MRIHYCGNMFTELFPSSGCLFLLIKICCIGAHVVSLFVSRSLPRKVSVRHNMIWLKFSSFLASCLFLHILKFICCKIPAFFCPPNICQHFSLLISILFKAQHEQFFYVSRCDLVVVYLKHCIMKHTDNMPLTFEE
jgi:hypothetical protein